MSTTEDPVSVCDSLVGLSLWEISLANSVGVKYNSVRFLGGQILNHGPNIFTQNREVVVAEKDIALAGVLILPVRGDYCLGKCFKARSSSSLELGIVEALRPFEKAPRAIIIDLLFDLRRISRLKFQVL